MNFGFFHIPCSVKMLLLISVLITSLFYNVIDFLLLHLHVLFHMNDCSLWRWLTALTCWCTFSESELNFQGRGELATLESKRTLFWFRPSVSAVLRLLCLRKHSAFYLDWKSMYCHTSWSSRKLQQTKLLPESLSVYIYMYEHTFSFARLQRLKRRKRFFIFKTSHLPPLPLSLLKKFLICYFFPRTRLKLCVRKWVLPWYVLAYFCNKSGSFIVGSRTQLIM